MSDGKFIQGEIRTVAFYAYSRDKVASEILRHMTGTSGTPGVISTREYGLHGREFKVKPFGLLTTGRYVRGNRGYHIFLAILTSPAVEDMFLQACFISRDQAVHVVSGKTRGKLFKWEDTKVTVGILPGRDKSLNITMKTSEQKGVVSVPKELRTAVYEILAAYLRRGWNWTAPGDLNETVQKPWGKPKTVKRKKRKVKRRPYKRHCTFAPSW